MLPTLRPLLAKTALLIVSLIISLAMGEFVLRSMGYEAIYRSTRRSR